MKKFLFIASLLFSFAASAFAPYPSQVVRFQSGLAKSQKPFASSGTLSIGDKRLPIVIGWHGPQRYSVQLSGLSRGVYVGDAGSPQWTLTRDGKNCSIKTDSQLVGCPAPSTWAILELSGSGDAAIKALRQSQILSEADMGYQETDSKKEMEGGAGKKRSQLNLGQNGALPIAVIEISGESAQKDAQGVVVPVVQYDQNFLAPLLLRVNEGTEVLTWKAASDLDVSKENPRFGYVLSSRLELLVGTTTVAVLSRKALQEGGKLTPLNTQRPIGDITAFKNSLSDEGLNVLKVLLLTH